MFNVTGGEIVIIILVALVVLGPERIPEVARNLGRLINKAKTMSQGLQNTVSDISGDPSMKPLKDLGELAARPRQKLAEFAAEAEAEERELQRQKQREQREAEQALAAAEADASSSDTEVGPPPARPAAEPSADHTDQPSADLPAEQSADLTSADHSDQPSADLAADTSGAAHDSNGSAHDDGETHGGYEGLAAHESAAPESATPLVDANGETGDKQQSQ